MAAGASAEKKAFERLPTDVVPVNYRLKLTPDLKNFTFAGDLEITAKVSKTTKRVKLNCAEIEILTATCGGQNATVSYDKEEETVCLEVNSDLQCGEVAIAMTYTGTLNDQMRGFYRSKYTHPDHPDEERYLACTQFENVTETKEVEGGLKSVNFARTPIMSTYLLAFIVGEFDYVEDTDENGVLIRVYTPIGKKEQGRFALNVATKTLPFYAKYFSVKYPLPKLDLIAIPDFAAGAMENWGLVTYRERLLLVDPVSTAIASQQYVALVVGHEIAHQWFGNLVTMDWWTHLWLNEGFATWIEYLCVDYCHPEYQCWTMFLSREYSHAMKPDSLANSHPIEVPVGPPSEVEEIFDAISYCKGASIIRMLHQWIGDDDFRIGMKNYLTKFAYSNARTEDLWEALENASGKPVATVMSTWTKQMGFPVLSVEAKQEGTKRLVTISQQKFCADGNITGFEDMEWKVPVTIATCKNKNALTFVLDKRCTTVTMEGVDPDDWLLVNPGLVGYYRVSYSSDLFDRLVLALKNGELSEQDRLGLQTDAFALARIGIGRSTVDVLKLFQAYVEETNYTVWENVVTNVKTIGNVLSTTSYYDSFKKYARGLFTSVLERVGWDPKESDSPLDKMLRSLVISAVGCYGDQATIEEARKRFGQVMACPKGKAPPIPAELMVAVFTIVGCNGDMETFKQFVELHDKVESSEEKARIYRCIGSANHAEVVEKSLEFAFSSGKVRNQDSCIVLLSCIAGCPLGREMTWDYVKKNFSSLSDNFKGGFLLARMLDFATSGFATEERAVEIEEFFKRNPCQTADRIIKQNCEAIRAKQKWLARDTKALEEWLKTI